MSGMSVYKQFNKVYKINNPLSNYAFSLFLFIEKLAKQSMADGITDLFFLSREGKFLKLLYDNYVSIKGLTSCPRAHYFYLSRKSIMNATLKDLNEEQFKILKVYYKLSIKNFLEVLNFSQDDVEIIERELHADIKLEYIDFFNSDIFKKLKTNQKFKSVYDSCRIKANENLHKYLRKSEFLDASKIALVDVGWKGTMQTHLFNMDICDELYGYYIGVVSSPDVESKNHKKGLLFHTNSYVHVFAHDCHNYEYLCVANHGGVCCYDDDGNPVLLNDEDCELYDDVFSNVQSNVMKKFHMLCEILKVNKCSETKLEKYCALQHSKMINNFSKTEKNILRNAIKKHPDNLINISPRKTWKKRLFCIKRFVYMRAQYFKYSFWFL